MLFGKKKTNIQQPINFKKEKLSAEALDRFAETYEEKNPETTFSPFHFTKLDGTQVVISARSLNANGGTGDKHFEYLLGQTLPYHKKDSVYSLKDLMYIVDEKGKPIMWTDKKTHIMQFIKLVEFEALLLPDIIETKDPKDPKYSKADNIKPVIHSDKEHPAPGEE